MLANLLPSSGMNIWGVRKGFVWGAMAGFCVAGSTLWALSSVQQLLHPPILESPPFLPSLNFQAVRHDIPAHLAWFFIQYPYLSEKATLLEKTRHTAIVSDPTRGKQYVISFGQRFRRVEIYSSDNAARVTIHVYNPGQKRTVVMENKTIVSKVSTADGNLWMWQSPLWNPKHLKIFGMADFWLNSPFKRFSCAGFVHKYLGDAGVKVPILDAWDMAKLPWTKIADDEMEPGDIIAIKAASDAHRRFWGHSITHVGVYIGNGKYIHAATSSRKAKRAFIRLGEIENIRPRIARVLRPPELL